MSARQLRLLAAPIALALSLTLPQLALAQFTPDIPIGLTSPTNVGTDLTSSSANGSSLTTQAASSARSTSRELPPAVTGFQFSFWAAAAIHLAIRRWFR